MQELELSSDAFHTITVIKLQKVSQQLIKGVHLNEVNLQEWIIGNKDTSCGTIEAKQMWFSNFS
jgi:hypothetical protein